MHNFMLFLKFLSTLSVIRIEVDFNNLLFDITIETIIYILEMFGRIK